MDLFWGDFSEISEPGSYRIRLANGSESTPFDIRNDVYAEVPFVLSFLVEGFAERQG